MGLKNLGKQKTSTELKIHEWTKLQSLLPANYFRYSSSSWQGVQLIETNNTAVGKRIQKLYTHGTDVTYGALFDKLLRYCHQPNNSSDAIITDKTLILELANNDFDSNSLFQCLEGILQHS